MPQLTQKIGILIGSNNGVRLIPADTPLARLNYFDGKLLRADDLNREQRYLRRLVELSNQSDGPGVAYGFNLTLGSGDKLNVGAGLAIDGPGRVLLLPEVQSVSIEDLIAGSRTTSTSKPQQKSAAKDVFSDCVDVAAEDPGSVTVPGVSLYLITIAHAEALCGQEDVFGLACEDACISSSGRPWWLEGVVLRAVPLRLRHPLPVSSSVPLTSIHLRSQVASAYFAGDPDRPASLISAAGLAMGTWCLGATGVSGNEVPIGVLAREGNTTRFLDAWIARRERIDSVSRRYWQQRMAMRPWSIFLAQILQFQCQLRDVVSDAGDPTSDDPCSNFRKVLAGASDTYSSLQQFYEKVTTRLSESPLASMSDIGDEKLKAAGFTMLRELSRQLEKTKAVYAIAPVSRRLIHRGIIELPSAGYLPVVPGSTIPVDEQVRRWMGEGVDLRFCVVRSDFVPHAIEEAQHMQRISLLEGLDDPANKPHVDILVPDGELVREQAKVTGTAFEVGWFPAATGVADQFRYRGVARLEDAGESGIEFYLAAGGALGDRFLPVNTAVAPSDYTAMMAYVSEARRRAYLSRAATLETPAAPQPPGLLLSTSFHVDKDVFRLERNASADAHLRLTAVSRSSGGADVSDIELFGTLRIVEAARDFGTRTRVGALLTGAIRYTHRNDSGPLPAVAPNPPLAVVIDRRNDGGGIIIRVTSKQGFNYGLGATWSGDPLTVPFELGWETPDSKLADIPGRLVANPQVMENNNTLNALARAVLDGLEAALDEDGFAAAQAKDLFASASTADQILRVKATRDWVAFHRRREKDCGEAAVAPPPAPERRYQVYHRAFQPSQMEAMLPKLREVLEKNDAAILSRLQFEPVEIVTFGGGIAQLSSNPADVRADWKKVNPGSAIALAAIGSQGPALDEHLAAARLGRLLEALAPVSSPPDAANTFELPQVDLPVGGTDGSIFLVTVRDTTKQRVLVATSTDLFLKAVDAAKANDWATILGQGFATAMGDVSFAQRTADPDAGDVSDLTAAWQSANLTPPRSGALFFVSGGTSAEQAVHPQQARVILDALNAKTLIPTPTDGLKNLEAGVSSVLLLFAGKSTAPSTNTLRMAMPFVRRSTAGPSEGGAEPAAGTSPTDGVTQPSGGTQPTRGGTQPAGGATQPAAGTTPTTQPAGGTTTPTQPAGGTTPSTGTTQPTAPGRTARLVFIVPATADKPASVLFPGRQFLIKFNSSGAVEGSVPKVPAQVRGAVTSMSLMMPKPDAKAKERAKVIFQMLSDDHWFTGTPKDPDVSKLSKDLEDQMVEGITELVVLETKS